MKQLNRVVRLTFWLAAMFAIVFLSQAESGNKRLTPTQQKRSADHEIHIVDQNGRPAVSGVPSATSQIVDVAVGQGGFVFVPDTVNISVGDTVRWTWATSGHSVTSGPPCEANSQYCSPNDTNCPAGTLSNSGTVYTHTFAEPGVYSYHCFAHCALGMTGVVNVSGGCAPSGWSAGQDLPSVGVRLAGVYFQANGKFYGMGGRSSDAAGSEFTHPFEYDPGTNSWTTKSATYPDTHVNNMACGVLADAGTPYIYCVGGSQVTVTGTFDRVFRYDPVTDVISPVAAPWPGGLGMVLPGGFTVFNNKLYILGGFDTITGGGQGTNQIWEFTPPTTWVQKTAVLPVPLGYLPTTTIGTLIYTGGGSDITGGVLTELKVKRGMWVKKGDIIAILSDEAREAQVAQAQAMAGQVEAATATFERAVAAINDVGLLAEEVDPASGEMIGNFPQAFSHIGLINAAWASPKPSS